MNFFRNIKIKSKLLLLVAVMLILTIFISVMGSNSVHSILTELEKSTNTITLPMEELNKANFAYGQMMIQTRDLSLISAVSSSGGNGTDSPDAVSSATAWVDETAAGSASGTGGNAWMWDINTTTYAEVHMKDYVDSLNSYYNILINHGIKSGNEYDALMTVIRSSNTILPMIQQCIDLAKIGNTQEASQYMVNVVKPKTEELNNGLQALTQINKEQSKTILTSAYKVWDDALLAIILSLIIGLIIVSPIIVIIISVIASPIRQMSEKAAELASGNIDIQVSGGSKDEIGILAGGFNQVISTMQGLIRAMDDMSRLQAAGDYDAMIDAGAFNGAYKNVAESINKMMTISIQEQQEILAALSSIANGSFNTSIRRFPGKKVSINNAIELFHQKLRGIYDEINTLAANAVNGRLNARIDISRYSGDWADLMKEMNNLLDAIVNPIYEASEVLQEMSKGNFDIAVKGDYKGDMEIIKKAVNETVSEISSYIMEITEILEAISKNDLSRKIDRNYIGHFSGIKDSLNKITETLNTVIGSINIAAHEVAQGALHMSNSSGIMADGAAKQAAVIEQLISTIDNVSSQINNSAKDAKHANQLSGASCEYAAAGNNEMAKMLTSMEEIKKSSNDISKIIKVIEDIAFQTNLLSLNASIEAARAGAQGHGFAVVAGEVRSLAAKSQQAAQDSATLIEESINKINEGSSTAKITSEKFGKITDSVKEVAALISNIADASDKQALSVGSLSSGLGEISSVVQNNSAVSQENLASSEELSSQSDMLRNMTNSFKLKAEKKRFNQ